MAWFSANVLPQAERTLSSSSPSSLARPSPLRGVAVESNPPKTTLRALDNAAIAFSGFRLPRSSLLSRFCQLGRAGEYTLELPGQAKRMLDILIFRLL